MGKQWAGLRPQSTIMKLLIWERPYDIYTIQYSALKPKEQPRETGRWAKRPGEAGDYDHNQTSWKNYLIWKKEKAVKK
ncbi:hypothetical protein CW304_02270 [Bacillus sp. UFRGS-B20]|nr:hypothetical protein CW304_02270 [Bacillus sp. UFRGS-B20]